MITFFTLPKPFSGHIEIIQKNALKSWKALSCVSEILILGEEPGIEEICSELGLRHIPDIEKNSYGTPMVSDAFRVAEREAKSDLICYVNSDIIFMDNFCEVAQKLSDRFSRFLAAGRRIDLDVTELIDFDAENNWQTNLIKIAKEKGIEHDIEGIDYFLFPKGAIGELPPFAVGRPAWDNWTIYQARSRGLPVVDLSPSLLVIHQNHDYRHVPQGSGKVWDGPENEDNWKSSKGFSYLFTLQDATYTICDGKIRRALDWWHLKRRPKAQFLMYPKLYEPWLEFRYRMARIWKRIRGKA